MGLKFRPTLKPPSASQFDEQIQDFCHSPTSIISKQGNHKTQCLTPKAIRKIKLGPSTRTKFLKDRLHDLRKELKLHISFNKPHSSNNLSKLERTEL